MNNSKKIGRFSMAHLKCPIAEGGLGILDPKIQHQTLQLRWVLPLLRQNTFQNIDSLDIGVSWTQHVILCIMNPTLFSIAGLSLLSSSSIKLNTHYILFSNQLRPQLASLLNLYLPIRSIVNCIDTLPDPHRHPDFQLSISTVLGLPINDIWFPSNEQCPLKPRIYNKVQVKHVYTFDNSQSRLIRRPTYDPDKQYPILGSRLHQSLMLNLSFLFPFSLRLLTPYNHVVGSIETRHITDFFTNKLSIDQITTESFRKSRTRNTPQRTTSVSRISGPTWVFFWRYRLNFRTKNIWLQILHNKINTSLTMHKYLPDLVPSPLCPLCSSSPHYLEHMFVTCQRVWQIWKKSFTYLYPQIPALYLLKPPEVLSSLYTFKFPCSKMFHLHTTPVFLFGAILEGIWKHYWRLIFDSTPFVPDEVVCTIIGIAHTYINQNSVHAKDFIII